ncbi:MAG: hypothetical protein WCT35_04725 [Sideroxydans sp.]|jgi:hypothetical protein
MKKNSTANAKVEFLANILKKGEAYAGILLGKNGDPDHHIILLPGQANDVTFQQAQEFAAKAGGDLPTRREQSLLFANLKEEFEERWYWSGEKHSDTRFAWNQLFAYGFQDVLFTSSTCRARAVRRIIID